MSLELEIARRLDRVEGEMGTLQTTLYNLEQKQDAMAEGLYLFQEHTAERFSGLNREIAGVHRELSGVHREVAGVHREISRSTRWILTALLGVAALVSVIHPLLWHLAERFLP